MSRVSTQRLSKQVCWPPGVQFRMNCQSRDWERLNFFLWSVCSSSRDDLGKKSNWITQVHWNLTKGYQITLPGREIGHEKLWDQLLERNGDVRVVRTCDVVQFNGSQDTVLHVEVLRILCLLATLILLRLGSCTDVAGHILLHQQRAITLGGCECFKASKQRENNITHTNWERTTAPSAFKCLQSLPGSTGWKWSHSWKKQFTAVYGVE